MHCFIIRDKDNQQQDIANLSRDTDNAHQALENNFDKDKIKDQLEIQKEAVALGTQAMDAYKQSKLNEAKADIRAQMAANGELDGLTEAQINDRILGSEQYKNLDKEYGVGSNFWTNGSAATGLLAGVLGGNVTGGMAAGAAPYMAALVKDSTDNPAARAALHAIVSGALASAQGANPGAAAAGGFIASASADALAMAFYGTTADKLVGDEKTMISNLVVLLGSAAGAAAGGDGHALASGGNAARVEVENNALKPLEKTQLEIAKQQLNSSDPEVREAAQKKVAELTELDISRDQKVIDACGNGNAASAACASARLEVIAIKDEYESGGSYNSKASQQYADAYGQIVDLLNITTVDAQNQQQVKDAMVNYFMVTQGVDRETALAYTETKQGMDIIIASITPIAGKNAADKLSSLGQSANLGKSSTVILEIDSKKFDYLYGKVTSSSHNADRSTQLAQTMRRLGLPTNEKGTALLTEHLNKTVNTKDNIIDTYTNGTQNFEVRESFLMGPSGKATVLHSSFEIMPDGSRRFVTTIPKEGTK